MVLSWSGMLAEHNCNLSATATAHCKLPVRATFSGRSPGKSVD
jgi:hypothetical protein